MYTGARIQEHVIYMHCMDVLASNHAGKKKKTRKKTNTDK